MTQSDALPWDDMDPDVLECGDPQTTHALFVKMLRQRAARARSIAEEQRKVAEDALESVGTFQNHAADFDRLADVLENAPITFPLPSESNHGR